MKNIKVSYWSNSYRSEATTTDMESVLQLFSRFLDTLQTSSNGEFHCTVTPDVDHHVDPDRDFPTECENPEELLIPVVVSAGFITSDPEGL